MITRSQMRRQLRAQGGIMNVAPRKKFGIGSVFQDFKDKVVDRTRKIIPNELANVAVKAAPFVAMIPGYGPAAAGIMRGLGRLDQRGNLTDAVKQGLLFYGGGKAFGAGMEKAGLRDPGASGIREFFNKDTVQRGRGLFQGGEDKIINNKKPPGTPKTEGVDIIQKGADKVFGKVPILKDLPDMVKQKLLVGGITSGASALYSYFTGAFDEPQQPGETMEEYMARRNTRVKQQMRGYMDSYYTPLRNPQYAAMSDEEKNNYIDSIVGQGMATGGRVGYQVGGISSANTLAQNIALNRANQAAFNQMIRPAQIRAAKITDAKITPAKITDAKITPIETRDLNLNRNPALDLLNQPQQPLSLKDIDQTGVPRQITQEDVDTFNFAPPVTPAGMQSLAGLNAIRDRVLATQAAMKPTYQERLMGESWETLSDNDQYRIAMEYPGETPPKRNPNFVPNMDAGLSGQQIAEKYGIPYASGGRVGFSDGSNLKIKLKQIGYEDTLLDGMSIKELRELLDSEKGTFTDQGTYREPANMGGVMGGSMPMGEPRVNQGGITELDFRAKGGFVPVGIKEKADDVPAMLSKNEFVFTADAVRGAGNGNIENGAQKMYDTMKNLERRVT